MNNYNNAPGNNIVINIIPKIREHFLFIYNFLARCRRLDNKCETKLLRTQMLLEYHG